MEVFGTAIPRFESWRPSHRPSPFCSQRSTGISAVIVGTYADLCGAHRLGLHWPNGHFLGARRISPSWLRARPRDQLVVTA